ncbi:hypothetical protein POG22_21435, partial [Geitlerinema sp. CS-897]|nr:hypothetical protein [Geitlerinema sp. CS-897]
MNHRPSGYAYYYSFHCLSFRQFVVWTLPSPSAVLLGCFPSSLYTFSDFGAWLGITTLQASPSLG